MDIANLVQATAGREQGKYFFVLETDGEYLLLADGKSRRLEKPKRKKRKHHNFCYLFNPFLQTHRAYAEAYQDYRKGRYNIQRCICYRAAEKLAEGGAFGYAQYRPVKIFKEIDNHPTRYYRIKHHKQIVSAYTEILHPMPFLTRFFENLKR